MATQLLTPFAALEQRLGRVSNTMLSNAVASFGATQLIGTFDSGVGTVRMGEVGVASRSPSFDCCTSDLPLGAVIGSAVSVLHLGITTVYEVADREDTRETSLTHFELQLP